MEYKFDLTQVINHLGTAFPQLKQLGVLEEKKKEEKIKLDINKRGGSDFKDIKTYNFSKKVANSFLGTPLFFPMKIDGVLLPNEPIITVSCVKNMIETPVAGYSKGSIKEITSFEDYKVNIKGIATNYDPINGVSKNTENMIYEDYPEDWAVLLNDLFRRERSETEKDCFSLPVKCDLLRFFGIHYLVIKSFKVPPLVGVQSALAYEFDCVSDVFLELVLFEKTLENKT